MARPSKDAIETFMSITGVTESVAVQKLEEYGGDLNDAVNAHFSEGDRTVSTVDETSVACRDNLMDFDNPIRHRPIRSPLSLLSTARNRDPFSIFDPDFGRGFFGGASDVGDRAPFVTHPKEVRQIPIEVKDGNETSGRSRDVPTIEDVTDTTDAYGPDVHGTVIMDDEDDEDVAAGPSANASLQNKRGDFGVSSSYDDLPEYGNDIEEEMIRAAIEASKKEAERIFHKENELSNLKESEKVAASNDSRLGAGSTSMLDDDDDKEEHPLVQSRSRRSSSTSIEARVHETRPQPESEGSYPQHSRNPFQSAEWGGITSQEHDEAVMLEAAMFGGGLPEGGYQVPYAPHQVMQSERSIPQWAPRPQSPSLEAQRLIREQQDDEFFASLKADQEKELRAKAEAEALRAQEEAARKGAIEAERLREEEKGRQLEKEKELERHLAVKEASLPQEPPADDGNAVTLLVRMPDGSRLGRRFLKSDKLQLLFDFIDIGRIVKPGTYRVVRPFPRLAFSDGDSNLTLNELGLTSKQEALFLEFK